MLFDGPGRKEQPLGDLAVGETVGDQSQNLDLAGGDAEGAERYRHIVVAAAASGHRPAGGAQERPAAQRGSLESVGGLRVETNAFAHPAARAQREVSVVRLRA